MAAALPPLTWRLHLRSPRERVYDMLGTAEGRARFWAEEAPERDGRIEFRFADGVTWSSRIFDRDPPARFVIEYVGGAVTTFELASDGEGGTDLTLTETHVSARVREIHAPGWVSVLLALKAAVDFGVDLRNHDPRRSWDQGYVDN